MTFGFPYRLVTFDLDGTLTRGHGWEVIADATGRRAEFDEGNRRFRRHETSEDGHLRELLRLAVGLRLDEVHQLLERTPRVEGIAATIETLHGLGARAALLTHNPSYVCDWYRAKFGFDDAEGTRGTVISEGVIVDAGPARADKPGGLGRLCQRLGVIPRAVAHVGDGWADAALFPRVGAGVAFRARLPDVRSAADAVVDGEDLTAIVPVLARLVPRTP